MTDPTANQRPVPDRRQKQSGSRYLDAMLLGFALLSMLGAVALALLASTRASDPPLALLIIAIAAFGLLIMAMIAISLVVHRVRHQTGSDSAAAERGIIYYVVLAGLPFVVLVGGVLTYGWIQRGGDSGPGALPDQLAITFFLTFSVMALLLTLSMTAIFFSWVKLADQRQALGLPEGSVRAVIALSLIIIFAIAAVFLYSRVASSAVFETNNLSEEEVRQIPPSERLATIPDPAPTVDPQATPLPPGATPEPVVQTYTVTRIDPAQVQGNDLAQQIITTISTLVVAVSAFYFGTSSVKSAVEAVGAGATTADKGLRILRPKPPVLLRSTSEGWAPIKIEVESTPPNQSIKGVIAVGDPDGALIQDEPGIFVYGAGIPDEQVLLRFSMVGDPTSEVVLLIERVDDDESAVPTDGTAGTGGGGSGAVSTAPETVPTADIPEEGLPDSSSTAVATRRDDTEVVGLNELLDDDEDELDDVPDEDADLEEDEGDDGDGLPDAGDDGKPPADPATSALTPEVGPADEAQPAPNAPLQGNAGPASKPQSGSAADVAEQKVADQAAQTAASASRKSESRKRAMDETRRRPTKGDFFTSD